MKLISGLFKVIGRAVTWTLLVGALAVVVGFVVLGTGFGDANPQAGRLGPLRDVAVGWTETHLKVLLSNPDSIDSSRITSWGLKVDWYYGPFAKIQTALDGMQRS
jgi:hypothetical protein